VPISQVDVVPCRSEPAVVATWHAKENTLAKLSSDFILYEYRVDIILVAWQLRICLRSGKTSLKKIIRLALRLSVSEGIVEATMKAIDDGMVRVPNKDTLQKCEHRMNLLDILWQRELLDQFEFARHWQGDSSPQGGYNLLVVLEDRIRWAKGRIVLELEFEELGEKIEKHHRLVTALGYGTVDVKYKAGNVQHGAAVESGSIAKYNETRNQVFSWTADQGDECEVSDSLDALQKKFEDSGYREASFGKESSMLPKITE
jgi:hypothetical protein